MSKKAETGTVPELRFAEFRKRSGWEEVPFDRVVTIHKGKGIAKADISPTGKLPCIRYGELYTRYGEVIDEVFSRTDVDPDELFLSEAGDVIIPASGETKEDIATAACVLRDGVALGSDLNVLRSDADGAFLSYYINHSKKRAIANVAQGDAVVHLYPHQLNKLTLTLPKPDEQQKIAACLSSVDALLAAEREKLDALRAHKKGLMQQLFPAEGKKVPELRFPGFGGEWGAEPLGKFTTKVGSGITPRGGDKTYLKEGRIFVRSQNVGWGLLLLNEVAYIDEETHQTFPGTEIQLNDVLLNLSGASIGRCAVADERLVGGNVNQHVCIIRVKEDLDPVYLEQFILSKPGQKQIDSFQAGGNRQGLNYDQVRSFSIPIPVDVDEQKEIAACLSSLDKRIALQDERVVILEQHKKGLMQGLFPANN
jgi:type I restriction enzyme S subunit